MSRRATFPSGTNPGGRCNWMKGGRTGSFASPLKKARDRALPEAKKAKADRKPPGVRRDRCGALGDQKRARRRAKGDQGWRGSYRSVRAASGQAERTPRPPPARFLARGLALNHPLYNIGIKTRLIAMLGLL